VAPSTYWAAKDRIPSARTVSDAVVTPELVTLWEGNYRVYGVRKLWKAARHVGVDIGRDQTGRLTRIGFYVTDLTFVSTWWIQLVVATPR